MDCSEIAEMTGRNKIKLSNEDEFGDFGHTDSGIIAEKRVIAKRPNMYKVLLHNDDYTPQEFVVGILETIFSKNHADAIDIMLAVHEKGIGVCGLYPFEVAETKAAQVTEIAREQEHPLKCTVEKA